MKIISSKVIICEKYNLLRLFFKIYLLERASKHCSQLWLYVSGIELKSPQLSIHIISCTITTQGSRFEPLLSHLNWVRSISSEVGL